MNAKQVMFVKKYLPDATKAGETTGLNPVVILAQAAFESGWGTSKLAREHNNFFGLTGYGSPNEYWSGKRIPAGRPPCLLYFRSYSTPAESFLDFARLIRSCYYLAWSVSSKPEAYAHEIAYSPYIHEGNGDNRAVYKASLISICRDIESIRALL